MNNDEYVPTITPTIKANINPLIESPPNKKIDNNTTNVVIEVLMVLPNVLLKALFTILLACIFSNSIKNYHRIIQGISNYCQDCSNK